MSTLPRTAPDHAPKPVELTSAPLPSPDAPSSDASPPPSRKSAGPRRSDATHRAVIDAAESLLAEFGIAGVTFEAVARRAGAGKPTLYRWWPDRTALLLEVHDRHKTEALSRPDTGCLEEDLTILLRDLWRFWSGGPAGRAYAAIICEAQSDDAAKARMAAVLNGPDFPLTPIFARAVARGELTDATEAAVLREYVAALNWFRLLTGRLVEADIPGLVAGLLARRRP